MKRMMLRMAAVAIVAAPLTILATNASGRADQAAPMSAPDLAAKINAEIGKLPNGASSADVEAAIAFAVSQSNASADVQNQALAMVASGTMSQTVKLAAGRVRVAMLERRGNGTGAIVGGNQQAFSSSAFSAPVVSVGGGSSSYTQ